MPADASSTTPGSWIVLALILLGVAAGVTSVLYWSNWVVEIPPQQAASQPATAPDSQPVVTTAPGASQPAPPTP